DRVVAAGGDDAALPDDLGAHRRFAAWRGARRFDLCVEGGRHQKESGQNERSFHPLLTGVGAPPPTRTDAVAWPAAPHGRRRWHCSLAAGAPTPAASPYSGIRR